jgi:hypothetical protein
MAAKNKPASRSRASDATAGITAAGANPATYLRALQHRDELLQEARTLLAAGRVREARAVEKRAAQIWQLLGALESDALPGSRPH